MDIKTIITIMSIPSAITGLCFWMVQRNINKKEKLREVKEKAKEQNQILLIRSVGAAIALGEATAIAIQNNKVNGEMAKALEYARQIKHEQKDFLTEQGVKNLF